MPREVYSDLCWDISLLCMFITLISLNKFYLIGWLKSYDPQLKGRSKLYNFFFVFNNYSFPIITLENHQSICTCDSCCQ